MTIYSIIDRPAWNNGIWAEVVQDYATARRSVDGTKVVVKWTAGEKTPAHLPDGAPLYYHPDDPPDDVTGYAGDILSVMDSAEWTPDPS
jgi:hypothetical protein